MTTVKTKRTILHAPMAPPLNRQSPEFTKGNAQASKDRGTVVHGAALMSFDVVQQVNANG